MTRPNPSARILADRILALHHEKSYRRIAREDFPGVAAGTLNRIAKERGRWMPKDRKILRLLGLIRREPKPEWRKPIDRGIRKMKKDTTHALARNASEEKVLVIKHD